MVQEWLVGVDQDVWDWTRVGQIYQGSPSYSPKSGAGAELGAVPRALACAPTTSAPEPGEPALAPVCPPCRRPEIRALARRTRRVVAVSKSQVEVRGWLAGQHA